MTLGNADGWTAPSTSPKLTGSLDLFIGRETRLTICRLLDLSGGLHFSKISMAFPGEDNAGLVTDLVLGCSGTLETLPSFITLLVCFLQLL